MNPAIEKLVAAATGLANRGQWHEAEKAWKEVHRLAPDNPRASFALGVHAYQRGDLREARHWLEQTVANVPSDMLGQLTLAAVCRAQGELEPERRAIEAALVIDPYNLPAMLCKADWFDRAGDAVAASAMYRNALKVAPSPTHWPESLRSQLERGRDIVERHTNLLATYLLDVLAPLQAALPVHSQSQWREATDLLAGRSTPFTAQSNQLHIPRLPAIPFYERERFPELAALEAQTEVIREELLILLAEHQQAFTPYISYAPGQPVNQWVELNHSSRWNAFHLWRGGEAVAENLERCPRTAQILAGMQLANISGLCPNVLFSALAPGTRIPPHHGETNARLVAHLPLVVPDGCRLRVGYEERSWTVGETLIFDDTLEHEASNDSEALRVVLIFDLWNPLLSQQDRQMVQAMTTAMRDFHP